MSAQTTTTPAEAAPQILQPDDERAKKIREGFRLYVVCICFQTYVYRNYMNMRDADTGKLMWETSNWHDRCLLCHLHSLGEMPLSSPRKREVYHF